MSVTSLHTSKYNKCRPKALLLILGFNTVTGTQKETLKNGGASILSATTPAVVEGVPNYG